MYRSVRKLSTGSNESNGGNCYNESNNTKSVERSFYEKGTGIFCGRHGRN